MNQTYNKKFHCTYLLHHYPFDTQVIKVTGNWRAQSAGLVQICKVDLQLQKFAQRNVMLIPDSIALLTDTELTQYFIQTWSLQYNHHGATSKTKNIVHIKYKIFVSLGEPEKGLKMEIVFKRRLTNELMTTYLPSALLLLISYATVFFKPFYFEAAVTVNLSLLLVITTLFVRRVQTYLQNSKSKRQISAWWKSFLQRLMFVWWISG